MLVPKLVGDSDTRNRKWYECPYCFDLFLADPSQVKIGGHSSCGCRKQTPVSRTTEEKMRWEWLRREIERNSPKNIPPLLLKLVPARKLAYRWNPEVNLDACKNFLEDTSPKPDNCTQGWKDPLGPLSPENFEWIPARGFKSSRTNSTTDST
jgi:hypothetical protein